MGLVYKAFDTILERPVALKVMHSHLLENQSNSERFLREARAAARLIHPNIVTIYEIGEYEDSRFLVMEYVQGKSLGDLLNRSSFNEKDAIVIGKQVLSGLQCAHDIGIFHRDIKSENIMLTANKTAKILDFGIAKMLALKEITATGNVVGTVQYMAPEQMMGEDVDHRCDIYASGVLLYQLATNHLPFEGENSVAILFKQLNEEPVPPSYYNAEISSSFDDIIMKALSARKEDRWADANSFIKALDGALDNGRSKEVFQMASNTTLSPAPREEEPPEQTPDNDTDRVFVGRTSEFNDLVSVFQHVHAERGQTVMLMGEAGVGKTTIADRFRRYASQRAWILYGACLYQEGMDTYLPYTDAFRDFFRNRSDDLPRDKYIQLKEIIRNKVPLLMEFTERFNTTMHSSQPSRNEISQMPSQNIFEGINLIISVLTSIRPVVVIIDDIQWVDEGSMQLFHYLSRNIADKQVMLMGICRTDRYDLQQDGKPTRIVDVLSRMRREGLYQEILLKRLDRDEVTSLIDQLFPSSVFSDEFYRRIYDETRGNPFFIRETLTRLCENGSLVKREDDIWHEAEGELELVVPDRVEDVFVRQLNGLDDESREILQVASVIGLKFDISLLSRLLEISKVKLMKRLHKIERGLQILSGNDRGLQFEHPMLRDILYNEIPSPLRREYHLMIAEDYETIYQDSLGSLVADVASHYRNGGDHARAIPHLFKAGIRAFKISAYREAISFLEQLCDSLERNKEPLKSDISRSEVFFTLGVCYEEVANWEKSLWAYERLQALGEEQLDFDMQVQACFRIGRLYDKRGNWEQALVVYHNCLDITIEHKINNMRTRIENNIGIVHFQQGKFDKAETHFLRTVENVDSDLALLDKAQALTSLGIIANIRSNYKEALVYYQQALTIFDDAGHSKYMANVHLNMGITYSDSGEWQTAVNSFKQCLKLQEKADNKYLIALTHLNMGKALTRADKLEEAKSHTNKALKIFRQIDDPLSLAEGYLISGMIASKENDFRKAQQYFQECIRINDQRNYGEGYAEGCMAYADLCQKFDYRESALEYYGKARDAYLRMQSADKADEVSKHLDALAFNE